MLRVLVTGVAGYIGSHCARLASLNGHEVSVSDNFSFGHRSTPQQSKLSRIVSDAVRWHRDVLPSILSK